MKHREHHFTHNFTLYLGEIFTFNSNPDNVINFSNIWSSLGSHLISEKLLVIECPIIRAQWSDTTIKSKVFHLPKITIICTIIKRYLHNILYMYKIKTITSLFKIIPYLFNMFCIYYLQNIVSLRYLHQ